MTGMKMRNQSVTAQFEAEVSESAIAQQDLSILFRWYCAMGESNPHGLPHRILNPARLPIPPPALIL